MTGSRDGRQLTATGRRGWCMSGSTTHSATAPRRRVLATALAAALPLPAFAQAFPSRPVRIVVPYPAGGTADAVGRLVAEHMRNGLGQSVVVENRAGAGGMLGAEQVARSAPDGYTLLLGLNGPISINPAIRTDMTYDPLRDLAPLTLLCEIPGLLGVTKALPANSIAELVALAKRSPGSIAFASQGSGTTGHLVGELLNVLGQVEMQHTPYRGTAPAMTDLIAGRVQFTFDLPPVLLPQQQAGTLRIIATSSRRRLSYLPDVATVTEQGFPDLTYFAWVGMLAPAGTPEPILQRLHAENLRILALPEVKERLATFGAEPSGLGLAEYRSYLAAEIVKWRNVARQANVKPD